MNPVQLIALDLDGTLFNNQSQITPKNHEAIQKALDHGIHVVISTGRPFSGLPMNQIAKTGIRYAITTNGSGVYELPSGKCIYENAMEEEIILPILEFLDTKDIHMDAFINGRAFSSEKCRAAAEKLDMPPSLKNYIINTRVRVSDLTGYIRQNHLPVQKMTLNFYPAGDGIFKDRETVKEFLLANPKIQCVSGGYHNLEFTKAGVTKGTGLLELTRRLGIPVENTMAIGDTENDIDILTAAGIGVAMGNATEDVKAKAGHITASNEEDGVAKAIFELAFHQPSST